MKKGMIVLLVLICISFPIFSNGTQEKVDDGKIVVGTIVPTLVNEFWVMYTEFQKKVAADLGIELVIMDSQDSSEKQIGNIEDCISRKVDGIVFVPYWSTGEPGFMKAEEAGIPVVATDSLTPGVDPQEQYKQFIAFVGPNDIKAGEDQAEYLLNNIKPSTDGKKYIVAMQGTLGTSVNERRLIGLKNVLDRNPDAVLLADQTANFLRDTGLKVMEDYLAAYPNIQGVWCANDAMALGAITAIEQSGRIPGKDILVSGMDLDKTALEFLDEGKMCLTAGGHWMQGGFGLIILYDYLNGKKISKENSIVQLNLLNVTKDTLQAFYSKYPGGQPAGYDAKKASRVYNSSVKEAYFEMSLE